MVDLDFLGRFLLGSICQAGIMHTQVILAVAAGEKSLREALSLKSIKNLSKRYRDWLQGVEASTEITELKRQLVQSKKGHTELEEELQSVQAAQNAEAAEYKANISNLECSKSSIEFELASCIAQLEAESKNMKEQHSTEIQALNTQLVELKTKEQELQGAKDLLEKAQIENSLRMEVRMSWFFMSIVTNGSSVHEQMFFFLHDFCIVLPRELMQSVEATCSFW